MDWSRQLYFWMLFELDLIWDDNWNTNLGYLREEAKVVFDAAWIILLCKFAIRLNNFLLLS